MTQGAGASLCVLASSSSGNCTALCVQDHSGERRIFLIDAGISPRRTAAFLASVGLKGITPHAVILTHLDIDHWHPGWAAAMPESTTVFMHRRHRGRAERSGLGHLRSDVFDTDFDPAPGVRVSPLLVKHDDLGTAAFRFTFADGATLGFITDAGRPTQELCDHVAGVDVLAIESNYCPRMQLASNRPDFLKQRIMGGKGHLSNEQSARAVSTIAPREAVVLLHLSRQCNTPAQAAAAHASAPCPVVISSHDTPTPWVHIANKKPAVVTRRAQELLWNI
ncbi:MAG: MBL fold metallo-hydrolase [Planctomycetes bacterium]|nr:MBL fold metallo-hydrolase [Planctomycetota bacterium]